MIQLTGEPIDVARVAAASPTAGALCLFLGTVRNHNAGRTVVSLEYEAFAEMALPAMQAIADEARRLWAIEEVHIVHRVGRLAVGDTSVAIAVTAAHRSEAFAACRFLVDTLKTRVPIWKKEHYQDGSHAWLGEPQP